jgi:hypothetical protein
MLCIYLSCRTYSSLLVCLTLTIEVQVWRMLLVTTEEVVSEVAGHIHFARCNQTR